MQGAPSAIPPASPEPEPVEAPAEPAYETVRLGGLELEVDAETKAAFEAELARLQYQTPAPPAQPTPAQPTQPSDTSPLSRIKDINTRLFTEPEAVLNELYQIAHQEISTSLRSEYKRGNTEKEFWSTFYQDNEDLAPNKLLVKAVVEREKPNLRGLRSINDVARHIADAARAELIRIKGGETSSSTRPRAVMRASPAGGRSPAAPAVKPQNVTSVSEHLRQRHAKRMGGDG